MNSTHQTLLILIAALASTFELSPVPAALTDASDTTPSVVVEFDHKGCHGQDAQELEIVVPHKGLVTYHNGSHDNCQLLTNLASHKGGQTINYVT